jgi:hypothetical protein
MSATKEQQKQWVPLAHSGILEKDIHAQVEILCHSASFENQGNARKLLRFLVEKAILGQKPSMKELSRLFRQIPIPSDNLVRNAGRTLRLALAEHYEKNAKVTEIHLDVPPYQYGVFAPKAPTGRSQAVNLDTRAIATILEPVQGAEVYRRVTVRGRIDALHPDLRPWLVIETPDGGGFYPQHWVSRESPDWEWDVYAGRAQHGIDDGGLFVIHLVAVTIDGDSIFYQFTKSGGDLFGSFLPADCIILDSKNVIRRDRRDKKRS